MCIITFKSDISLFLSNPLGALWIVYKFGIRSVPLTKQWQTIKHKIVWFITDSRQNLGVIATSTRICKNYSIIAKPMQQLLTMDNIHFGSSNIRPVSGYIWPDSKMGFTFLLSNLLFFLDTDHLPNTTLRVHKIWSFPSVYKLTSFKMKKTFKKENCDLWKSAYFIPKAQVYVTHLLVIRHTRSSSLKLSRVGFARKNPHKIPEIVFHHVSIQLHLVWLSCF